MNDFLQRLKQHKLVQWAIAYVAFAFALVQVLEAVAGSYHWPDAIMHIAFGVLALGFVVVLVLAWYHGERGAQRISGPELLLIALVLAVGGGLLWHYARTPASSGVNRTMASTRATPPAGSASTQAIAGKAAVPTSSAALAATPSVPTPPIPAKSVAVLPFENLSTDKANAYFADGMQDLILTKLADIGDLKVISRTSTEQYGSHPGNLRKIARELRVATILEGSVQKAGNQVLINVQLIDANTDTHIWAKSYQRTLDNIFGVEGEVAGKVAEALNAKLTTQEAAAVTRVPTTNPQAYTLYLKAQRGLDTVFNGTARSSDAVLHESAQYLRQAIVLDPNFAAAYAQLALVETGLSNNNEYQGIVDKSISPQIAMAHARKALDLQPDLPIAHAVVGMLLEQEGKAGGLQELEEAARLAPGNVFVSAMLAGLHMQRGEWRQADALAHKTASLDPRNPLGYQVAAMSSIYLRNYADARQMLELGLAVNPDDMALHQLMGRLLLLLGDFAGARAQYAKLPAGPEYTKFSELAYAWSMSRNYTEAFKVALQMEPVKSGMHRASSVGMREFLIGLCELQLGNKAGAAATLTEGRAGIQAALREHSQGFAGADLYNSLAYIEMLLGHRDAALQAIDKAIAQAVSISNKESVPGSHQPAMAVAPGYYESKAEILAHFGDADGATGILDKLFQTEGTGYEISPTLLRLNPVWDPIRKDPRFQVLLKKYGQSEPAAASRGAGHG